MSDQSKMETVQVKRVFQAAAKDVFEAWIETETVQLWWGCEQTTQVRSEVQPEVGGKYRHQMTIQQHGDHTIDGIFTEYDPPRRLAYKTTEGQLVEVDFLEVEQGTEVVVTHSRLPGEFVQFVVPGWTAALKKLDAIFVGAV